MLIEELEELKELIKLKYSLYHLSPLSSTFVFPVTCNRHLEGSFSEGFKQTHCTDKTNLFIIVKINSKRIASSSVQ